MPKPTHRSSTQYPTLSQMIVALAEDNYGSMASSHIKPRRQWAWPTDTRVGATLAELEAAATSLTAEERAIIVMGEYSEQQQVLARHPAVVTHLYEFIGNVFDGDLGRCFYSF